MKQATLLIVLAVLWMAPATAAEPGVSVSVVAQLEETVTAADGSSQTRLVPMTTVVPGDEVVFTVSWRNSGSEPAENVVLGNPIPPQMRFSGIDDAGAEAQVEFSVDGGETWAQPGALTVQLANGTRPATAADYTNIRWRLVNPVAPGDEGFVRYRAIVK